MVSIEIKERQGKHFIDDAVAHYTDGIGVKGGANPAFEDDEFWKTLVTGWYEAFQTGRNGNDDKVRRFYSQYGLLMPLLNSKRVWEETWELCEAALGWFKCLTYLLECLEAGKKGRGRIESLFESPLYLQLGERITLYESDYPLYRIVWEPPLGDDLDRLPTPKDDYELYEATWHVITQEVHKYLNLIPLSPVTVEQNGTRNLMWQFSAAGAFEFAFLQWYFQKVAHRKLDPCAKPNCDNLPEHGSDYCSRQCAQATHKQRQRKRKKDALALKAQGYSLINICETIYSEEEWRRLENMNKSPKKIVAGWLKKK